MKNRASGQHPAFRLKPVRSARVSEISEATAAAPVPPEERVNLHIGNPLQDPRLQKLFLELATGGDDTSWTEEAPALKAFLERLIKKSSPYTPRGGFQSRDPDPLVLHFTAWLEGQQDSLSYDLGRDSGRREIVLATGGIPECLRVFFHSLDRYLAAQRAHVACFGAPLPDSLKAFSSLIFHELSHDEDVMLGQIEELLRTTAETPVFLLLGRVAGEETRRQLRTLCLDNPLFFVECNDAFNHVSLGREARLTQRVLRFLTPGIFSPRFRELATVFVAGPSDFLRVFENVHFELKGSPSASEIELLSFLLENPALTAGAPLRAESLAPAEATGANPVLNGQAWEGLGWRLAAGTRLPQLAGQVETRLEHWLDRNQARFTAIAGRFGETANRASLRLRSRPVLGGLAVANQGNDDFAHLPAREFLEKTLEAIDSRSWIESLCTSYLSVFVKHQPQYRIENCEVVSGSARTALGLLGFHCGISEVIIPDLSWSYEHCFPRVHAVPLKAGFELDAEVIVAAVERQIAADPTWPHRGAVVLNNPHNATGKVFAQDSVRTLLRRLLALDVFVIDDLSYQNVAPVNGLPEIPTLRQHSVELRRQGLITSDQARRVITVHSLSKTDCLAGARMSVVEIPFEPLRREFRKWNSSIAPNVGAITLSTLFYRSNRQAVQAYWALRNRLFMERSSALVKAAESVPRSRNPFDIIVLPPTGSMYPILRIGRLPSGLSLDWLASGLARQGIGMLPLGTFARTETGFEEARTCFRLTLGGSEGADNLRKKMRQVLIDFNHRVEQEASNYIRASLPPAGPGAAADSDTLEQHHLDSRWQTVCRDVESEFRASREGGECSEDALKHLHARLSHFHTRLLDQLRISRALLKQVRSDQGAMLADILGSEFRKDSLERRQEAFRLRSFDRTVHPTQVYSIEVELRMDEILSCLLEKKPVSDEKLRRTAHELRAEFQGSNVKIDSRGEAREILLDLDSLIRAEHHARLTADVRLPSLISFWSDWDGSNRPSGQGHRLVASVLMENVNRLARLLGLVRDAHGVTGMDPSLLASLQLLPERNRKFTALLDEITSLTHQLEERYRGVLPVSLKRHPLRALGMRLRLLPDPLRKTWKHNDRLERRMRELRARRREMLEEYFALNKKLRKQLHQLIPVICSDTGRTELILAAAWYRDLLQRVIITPRIQQGQITAKDQFAIETTIHNLYELNELAGRYGNPGLVLALQISLATKAEGIISLDRKMTARREALMREYADTEVPGIWLIPLFEDLDSVKGIPVFLEKVWDYALQSRRATQEIQERLAEILCEIFIAGSDLSQQVGQAAGAWWFRQAKWQVHTWLAERGLADRIRMKLGSGEPMERQGGYYFPHSGKPAFIAANEAARRFAELLPASTRRNTLYAVTPLGGVFSGGDLRTFQSNISEQLRRLSAHELAELLHHVSETQRTHRQALISASEALVDSRMRSKSRSAGRLERLTVGTREPLFADFLPLLTENFRQILYGSDEDVVGIHVASYFIARSMPQLRDRPTVRKSRTNGGHRGEEILNRLAESLPQSKQGSQLRAIAHNQAQSAILGVNQLTTGLFRALDAYGRKVFAVGEREAMTSERLLSFLPVQEILSSLRLYHDPANPYLRKVERAFHAANSAFVALREDLDAMQWLLPLFQKELLRRHGLDTEDFFLEGKINPELLPTFRPDLAVLLQPDLFNTDLQRFLQGVSGQLDPAWVQDVEEQLSVPREIRRLRALAWDILEESVLERVRSYCELALALQSSAWAASASARTTAGTDIHAPVQLVRAITEVDRLARIEEFTLAPEAADQLRWIQLQIARLAGENG